MDKLELKPQIPADGLPAFVTPQGVAKWQGRTDHSLTPIDNPAGFPQEIRYEALWQLCGASLRVMITTKFESASTDWLVGGRSFAKVQSHDGERWNFLAELQPKEAFKTGFHPAVTDTDVEMMPYFEAACDRVLLKACAILNPRYAEAEKDALEVIATWDPNRRYGPTQIMEILGRFITDHGLAPALKTYLDELE